MRVAGLTSMEMPVRIPQTRIVSSPRESPFGLNRQISTTRGLSYKGFILKRHPMLGRHLACVIAGVDLVLILAGCAPSQTADESTVSPITYQPGQSAISPTAPAPTV